MDDRGESSRGAEVSFANAEGANFFRADLSGCLMYRTQVRHARFDEATITNDSDIPNWRSSNTGRPIKRKKEEIAGIPERPLYLLILGDPMGPYQRYEGSLNAPESTGWPTCGRAVEECAFHDRRFGPL
jgi:hypothetical protein